MALTRKCFVKGCKKQLPPEERFCQAHREEMPDWLRGRWTAADNKQRVAVTESQNLAASKLFGEAIKHTNNFFEE